MSTLEIKESNIIQIPFLNEKGSRLGEPKLHGYPIRKVYTAPRDPQTCWRLSSPAR